MASNASPFHIVPSLLFRRSHSRFTPAALLQNSLDGNSNSKAIMCVNVSPVWKSETVQSLTFGSASMGIVTGKGKGRGQATAGASLSSRPSASVSGSSGASPELEPEPRFTLTPVLTLTPNLILPSPLPLAKHLTNRPSLSSLQQALRTVHDPRPIGPPAQVRAK